MGASFGDITLYTPSSYEDGSHEHSEEHSLINFVSDLYVQNMNGYKPPKTSRITIQPAFHKIWDRTWKNGSIISIAPFFDHKEFSVLPKSGKYKHILDLIQTSTIQLSDEYGWNKNIFENAYNETLASNFNFRIAYPQKQSKDRKKSGTIVITKNERTSSAYVEIHINGAITIRKLFDKKNSYWYDCIYNLAKCSKWFDLDKFGISYKRGEIEILYSIEKDQIQLYEAGKPVAEINFAKYFLFS